MRKRWQNLAVAIGIPVILALAGCSKATDPGPEMQNQSLLSTSAVVSQDLAQLSTAGVTAAWSKGIFSIGWKKFVGPNITEEGTIGEAFAVVQGEANTTFVRPVGIDIGTVTIAYDGGSTELTKRVAPGGRVMYTTFEKKRNMLQSTPVNIPFVANGVYTFNVGGSSNFGPGAFQITAPPSLLSISSHAKGDIVSRASDLTLEWTGGSAEDDVLVRIIPHLKPAQFSQREDAVGPEGPDGHKGMGGLGGRREGKFMRGGPLEGMGPEFARGVVVTIPNTGKYTVTASDLQTLFDGTEATELMCGVTQVVKREVVHEGNALTILLRNGDRVVLQVQ